MICLMFAGCSNSDTTSDSRGFTDFEHIEEEYLATIDSLDWPDGVELPKKLENPRGFSNYVKEVVYGYTISCERKTIRRLGFD